MNDLVETEASEPEAFNLPELPPANGHPIEQVLHKAFGAASTLTLPEPEAKSLMRKFSDDDVEILPSGEVYIPHMLVRERLTETLGPGQWSMLSTGEKYADGQVYCRWVMLVRGVRVGETWSASQYQENNPRSTLDDAIEGTEGIAVRRIAGKMLSCGSQVWHPAYCREWIKTNAIKVWCKDKRDGKSKPQWRRKDRDKFWNETGPVSYEPTSYAQEITPEPAAAPLPPPRAMSEVVSKWSRWIQGNVAIKDFNEKLNELSELENGTKRVVWAMLQEHGVQRGWKFDKDTKQFVVDAGPEPL